MPRSRQKGKNYGKERKNAEAAPGDGARRSLRMAQGGGRHRHVTAGEPLFEIETDKVVNQIEATESGILKRQLVEEGDTVPVETAVAILEEN